MFRILQKVFVLFFILFLTSIFLNKIQYLPFYWGNEQLKSKVLYLEAQEKLPNTYFIGSSITYHGIDPVLFCEMTGQSEYSAFNLGIDGAFPPQTFYFVEEMIANLDSIKYIFFEMNSLDRMADHIFQTTRGKYYYQIEHLWMSIRYLYFSNYLKAKDLRITHKLGVVLKHGITFLESMFKIGMRKEMITVLATKTNSEIASKKKSGYQPILDKKRTKQTDLDNLAHFLKSAEKEFVDAYSIKSSQVTYNPVLQEALIELINKAEAKGVTLVYSLTPFECAFDSVPEMLALFQSLPEKNRIDLANPNKFPAFYKIENRWDAGHFNDAGATIYTQKLAELANQLPN